MVEQHVIEQSFSLVGEDGAPVVGVQMGIFAECRIQLKFYASRFNYLEIFLDRSLHPLHPPSLAQALPLSDSQSVPSSIPLPQGSQLQFPSVPVPVIMTLTIPVTRECDHEGIRDRGRDRDPE